MHNCEHYILIHHYLYINQVFFSNWCQDELVKTYVIIRWFIYKYLKFE